MTALQIFIQTIWASILVIGWIKLILALVVIAILSRMQPLLGLIALILFLAYLAHWI